MLIYSEDLKRALAEGEDIHAWMEKQEANELETLRKSEKAMIFDALESTFYGVLDSIVYLSTEEIEDYVVTACQELLRRKGW